MPFGIPMVWREQADHTTDCYFFLTDIKGFSRKNKSKIKYPDCRSAMKPVPHSSEVPIPSPPPTGALDEDALSSQSQSSSEASESEMCIDEIEPHDPILINQHLLNNLLRDLVLPKNKAELLGSRLKQWNLLKTGTKITFPRQRQDELSLFFTNKNTLCFCNNVSALMESLGYQHVSDQWRLFIDASKTSLKAVLLYNGNTKPSLPLAYAVNMKESYESMKILLEAIEYSKYSWKVCGDLKVISLLLGLQLAYTKHMCFLCLWDSRDDSNHYSRTIWPPRKELAVGRYNVKHTPLIDPQKVYLPPLHIKLGLMKNFVKAMDQHGKGFQYLLEKFGFRKSNAKLKAGVFVGPDIRNLIKDENFDQCLNSLELCAWKSFKQVEHNFLGYK